MNQLFRQLLRRASLHRSFETYNRIEISELAIKRNLALFHGLDDAPAVMPVLKANAYGHGIEQVAKIIAAAKLPWVPYIAVDSYYEAIKIRRVTDYPVLIMGKIRPHNFKRLVYKNFSFVISDRESVESLGKTGRQLKVHIELNTGMNRYGVTPTGVSELIEVIRKYPNLEVDGIMSHLADSDGASEATITKAVDLFDETVMTIEASIGPVRYKHIAQTAGSVRARSTTANTVRPGIGVFGINPFASTHPCYDQLAGLQPSMRFVAKIAEIQEVAKGEGISYNYTYRAPRTMRVAIIPVGYYEGIPRTLSSNGFVKWKDQYLPIVGRVCMNHTMIDITDVAAQVGDELEVFSRESKDKNSIESIAAKHDLFSYELLAHLAPDTRRCIVNR